MRRGILYFFDIFWDIELWREAESCKSLGSLGLFTPPPYMPIKGAFVIFCVCVRYQKRVLHMVEVWAVGFQDGHAQWKHNGFQNLN